ncbi:unnamed protein product, partial [Protopolystoma xenopodis]
SLYSLIGQHRKRLIPPEHNDVRPSSPFQLQPGCLPVPNARVSCLVDPHSDWLQSPPSQFKGELAQPEEVGWLRFARIGLVVRATLFKVVCHSSCHDSQHQTVDLVHSQTFRQRRSRHHQRVLPFCAQTYKFVKEAGEVKPAKRLRMYQVHAVDWLYWNIQADAVSEVNCFDSGEKVQSFRPPHDEHHQSKNGIIITTKFKLTSPNYFEQSLRNSRASLLDVEVQIRYASSRLKEVVVRLRCPFKRKMCHVKMHSLFLLPFYRQPRLKGDCDGDGDVDGNGNGNVDGGALRLSMHDEVAVRLRNGQSLANLAASWLQLTNRARQTRFVPPAEVLAKIRPTDPDLSGASALWFVSTEHLLAYLPCSTLVATSLSGELFCRLLVLFQTRLLGPPRGFSCRLDGGSSRRNHFDKPRKAKTWLARLEPIRRIPECSSPSTWSSKQTRTTVHVTGATVD